MLFWKLYSSDYQDLDKRFRGIYEFIKQAGIKLDNSIILELGPGNSCINAYHFLFKGAQRVILVDKYPRITNTARQESYNRSELDYVLSQYQEYQAALPGFFNAEGKPDNEHLQFFRGDITEMGTMEKVDFIYSVSVLEHIKDVPGNIKQMAKILKPGGYMYHHIDLRDHYNFNHPFLFYKYPDWLWERLLTKEGISYTNRWRYDDLLSAFIASGLEVVEERTQEFPVSPKLKIHERFRSCAHINIGILDIILQKSQN
ncbi:methyltransferase domain-containing protein [Chloroflexota bacterium]